MRLVAMMLSPSLIRSTDAQLTHGSAKPMISLYVRYLSKELHGVVSGPAYGGDPGVGRPGLGVPLPGGVTMRTPAPIKNRQPLSILHSLTQ